jgi:hypothetical protein
LTIQVTGVNRDAWTSIQNTNPSNQQPRPDYVYIMVSLRIDYTNGPTDLPVSLDRYDFTLIDTNDALYSPAFVFEPQPLISQTVFPHSRVDGQVAFQVPRSGPDVSLVWRYNSDNPVWFATS